MKEQMRAIISSKRVSRYNGQLIGFNEKRTRFYRILNTDIHGRPALMPMQAQVRQGGYDVEPLNLDETERELILLAWRLGKQNHLIGGIKPNALLADSRQI